MKWDTLIALTQEINVNIQMCRLVKNWLWMSVWPQIKLNLKWPSWKVRYDSCYTDKKNKSPPICKIFILIFTGQRGRPGRAFDGRPGQMGERGHVGRPGLRGHPGLPGVPGVCLTSGCGLVKGTDGNTPQQESQSSSRRIPQRLRARQ